MAIRKPSIYLKNDWVVQDFLYYDAGSEGELRFIQVKWDSEEFQYTKQTFDYLSPDRKGGPIIARIDYTINGNLVTVDNWEVNWRDEWPLRLGIQYLVHCLYRTSLGYVIRVDKEALPFWVSEDFDPITNDPEDYLIQS
jgi:hypothetical protein